ncbi:hypothetical protein CASFOL_029083 [Castilleja foliolosa]|uniref:Uncharacterized protein n=1 Tax=Castilleja foliolosa TaxID=1961234 RepID=A0ABD3CCW3_9LAMI
MKTLEITKTTLKSLVKPCSLTRVLLPGEKPNRKSHNPAPFVLALSPTSFPKFKRRQLELIRPALVHKIKLSITPITAQSNPILKNLDLNISRKVVVMEYNSVLLRSSLSCKKIGRYILLSPDGGKVLHIAPVFSGFIRKLSVVVVTMESPKNRGGIGFNTEIKVAIRNAKLNPHIHSFDFRFCTIHSFHSSPERKNGNTLLVSEYTSNRASMIFVPSIHIELQYSRGRFLPTDPVPFLDMRRFQWDAQPIQNLSFPFGCHNFWRVCEVNKLASRDNSFDYMVRIHGVFIEPSPASGFPYLPNTTPKNPQRSVTPLRSEAPTSHPDIKEMSNVDSLNSSSKSTFKIAPHTNSNIRVQEEYGSLKNSPQESPLLSWKSLVPDFISPFQSLQLISRKEVLKIRSKLPSYFESEFSVVLRKKRITIPIVSPKIYLSVPNKPLCTSLKPYNMRPTSHVGHRWCLSKI